MPKLKMMTFCIGIFILIIGYIFYSRYTESQFGVEDKPTPAYAIHDGVDFVPLSKNKNMLIHLLNIAGLGPILGAIQGVLFGPIAFILIPLGCIFMGGVHDYFSGMISVRNKGTQITGLIRHIWVIFLCGVYAFGFRDIAFGGVSFCLYRRRFDCATLFSSK